MKLFYGPGACSLAVHIALKELEYRFDLERVSFSENLNVDKLLLHDPKGYIPALVLDDGETLTETSTILQYLADQKPEAHLIPKPGTKERRRCLEWLNYVGMELHSLNVPFFLFDDKFTEPVAGLFRRELESKFASLDQHFAKNKFLLGDRYSVADTYCFVVTTWAKWVDVDTTRFKNLSRFVDTVMSRAATRAAMEAEGIWES